MSRTPSSTDLRRRVLVSLLLVAVLLVVAAAGFRGLLALRKAPERLETTAPLAAVRVLALARGEHEEWLHGYGQARALRRTDVAAEVPGVVSWISPRLEAGVLVKDGEELVRLEDRDLQSARDRASAELEQTSASLERARREQETLRKRKDLAERELKSATAELARIQDLVQRKTASESELDRERLKATAREHALLELEGQLAAKEQDVARLEAQETAARAGLDRAKHDLERAEISAPYAGRIEERDVSLGASLAPGAMLFRVVDPAQVEVAVALPASRFHEVRPGAPARLRLSEDAEVIWDGEVARVSATVSPQDRTFLAYVDVSVPAGAAPVPPGAFVVAEIRGSTHENVIVVPRLAFVGDRVYVIERDLAEPGLGICRARVPRVVRRMPDVALVTEGLEAGDELVVTNLEQVAEGARVRLVAEPVEQQ